MAVSEVQAPIAIRPLARGDIRRVRRLERAAYGSSTPRTPFERELRNGLATYLVAVAGADDDAATLDAVPGNEAGAGRARAGVLGRLRGLFAPADTGPPIVGFAGVWYTHEQLHLVTIAVEPEHQGEGIGQALLLAVCDLAEDAQLDSIALEVRASNVRALRLYEHFGFRRGGRLGNYYSDNGEDAIVMLLEGLAGPAEPRTLARARAEHARRFGARFTAVRAD